MMKCLGQTVVALLAMMLVGSAGPPKPRYIVNPRVSIHTHDGATLSAMVVLRADARSRQPAALVFTIYPDPKRDIQRLEYAADRGYVGVVAYTRGKAYSPQPAVPYEDDGRDANAVINWIAAQQWSNGDVGMFGGSYDGFTQWAAAKFANPHLKTIVPIVPNNPANGLPLQNGVFLPVNYAWIYYVTDNKFLDAAAYDDPRWRTLNQRWYRSGRAYRDIDAVAGKPNPWLHKWLAHPSYDSYWDAMLPNRSDYARITIPVLTIAGYYGDSTAIGFFNDFQRYNQSARNYLVIGPWDHFGSQGRVKPAVLRGYRIDPLAQIDTWQLTFNWLDYVLRGKPKPALVRGRVNYEVMGENVWRHAPSLAAMGTSLQLNLSTKRVNRSYYQLSSTPQKHIASLHQRIDFADRTTSNNDSYPYLILGKKLDPSDGFDFLTSPLPRAAEVSGFDGAIHVVVNKRDLDIGLAMYELPLNGKLVELGYYTQRASYARDPSERTLLAPGKETVVRFQQDYLFSRYVAKGSRLLLTVDVNRNPFAEINYGTGKDVASETIHDAGAPMEIQWLTTSYVRIRIASPRR